MRAYVRVPMCLQRLTSALGTRVRMAPPAWMASLATPASALVATLASPAKQVGTLRNVTGASLPML